MADNYLITGYWGEPHVTAENDRGINAAMFGSGRFVLPVGEQFKAEYIGNNTVRMYDGKLMNNGAAAGIPAGGFIDILIPNASQGMKRNDLIVFQYAQDTSTLVEKGEFVVVSGTETTGAAADPQLTQQNLLTNKATFDQMALWRVSVSGATIAAPQKVFTTLNVGLLDHVSNQSNPHKVTKSQVGLSNVPNVSTNNQTPTYTAASTLAGLTSGEKLSVAFGKIAKSVTDLIAHVADNSNPHGVTTSQIGAANASEHKVKTFTSLSDSVGINQDDESFTDAMAACRKLYDILPASSELRLIVTGSDYKLGKALLDKINADLGTSWSSYLHVTFKRWGVNILEVTATPQVGSISGYEVSFVYRHSTDGGRLSAATYTRTPNGFANKEHTHTVDDVFGTLPVSKGGTGGTTGTSALYNLISPCTTVVSTSLDGDDYIPFMDVSTENAKRIRLDNLVTKLISSSGYGLSKVKIVTDTYDGVGGGGEDSPNSYTFDFTPKVVILSSPEIYTSQTSGATQTFYYNDAIMINAGEETSEAIVMMATTSVAPGESTGDKSTSFTVLNYAFNGKTVSWWNTGHGGRGQFNDSGSTYKITAIG